MLKWFGVTLVCGMVFLSAEQPVRGLTVDSGGDMSFAEDYPVIPAATTVAAAPSAGGPRLEIKQFQFSQSALTVPVNTTVTWVNRDDDAHTVTADDGRFTSAGLDRGEQFAHQFTASGTYAYHCALHPKMTAKIVVK